MSPWRHVRAIALLPFTVTVIVPAAIVFTARAMRLGWGLPQPFLLVPPVLGGALIILGVLLAARAMALFATVGQGTPAPWDPPRRLVVRGIYRHVRNPMISGVFSILLGEAALLGSLPLLIWFLAFAALNSFYIPLVEERGLLRRFGEDYERYRKNVPLWIPRLRPWIPPPG